MTEPLRWREDAIGAAINRHTWTAALPWQEGLSAQDGYYRIYAWKNEWAFRRPDHPELGSFGGAVSDLAVAQQLCQEDFERVDRLHRWVEFMTENDPPIISSKKGIYVDREIFEGGGG